MGTILASSVINKAAAILFDINGVQWSRLELLGWLNDGQRQITAIAPTANNVTKAIQMAAGSRQAIPTDGWTLLDVYRNMGTNGLVPGLALRIVDKKALDAFNPSWHFSTPAVAVREYVFDTNDQNHFWVSPPSDGTGWVEVNYSQSPADLANEATAITLNDIYEPVLLNYMLYRCCEKHEEFSPGMDVAAKYWAAFSAGVGLKAEAEDVADPTNKLARTPPPGAAP